MNILILFIAMFIASIAGEEIEDAEISNLSSTSSEGDQNTATIRRTTIKGGSNQHKSTKQHKELKHKAGNKMQNIPKVVLSHTGTYNHKTNVKVKQDAKVNFGNQQTFHRIKQGFKPFRKMTHVRLHKMMSHQEKPMRKHISGILHKMPLVEEAAVKKEELKTGLNSNIQQLPLTDHIPIMNHAKASLSNSNSLNNVDKIEPIDFVEPMDFISVEENESMESPHKEPYQAENAHKRTHSKSNQHIVKAFDGHKFEGHTGDLPHHEKDHKAPKTPMGAFGAFKPKGEEDYHDDDYEEDEDFIKQPSEIFIRSEISDAPENLNDADNNNEELSGSESGAESGEESGDESGSGETEDASSGNVEESGDDE